ncbi:MAG: ATP-binding protein [Bacteroidota bacterium]|nr:ATP-binding protein [Bacteroidota bacterium]
MQATSLFTTAFNIQFVNTELKWLTDRILQLITTEDPSELLPHAPMQALDERSHYAKFMLDWNANEAERVAIALCFTHLYRPELLSGFFAALKNNDKRSAAGIYTSEQTGQLNLTIRTMVYVLAGNDDEKRGFYFSYFTPQHRLFTEGILREQGPREETVSFLRHTVEMNDIFIDTLLHGAPPRLDGEAGFPAVKSNATHTMDDVVLDAVTKKEMEEIRTFAQQMNKLWALPEAKMYKGNCVCIFTGEPGTGKSHTAAALGNEFGMPVYMVNTAQLVSKYIGETEKNLEKILDRFDNKNCILFFDEAESIFSKRTEVKDAHDRYANQEQSYLLWKMTRFHGIIILATNVTDIRQYFDKAFLRRFYRIINIPFPNYQERKQLWKKSLGESFTYDEGLTERLARDFQLTGGGIYNVVSDGVVKALEAKTKVITYPLMEQALISEFNKTGRKFEICTDEQIHINPVRRFGPGYEKRSLIG